MLIYFPACLFGLQVLDRCDICNGGPLIWTRQKHV
jgi:hypothetical protein